MAAFPGVHYERIVSAEEEEDDGEEEISELPPTVVTTRGPEKNSMIFINTLFSILSRLHLYLLSRGRHRTTYYICI